MFHNSPNFFFIYLIKKNISIKVLKEALGVKDDAEGAECDDLEEANIGIFILFYSMFIFGCKKSFRFFAPSLYVKKVLKYKKY